MAGSMTPFGSIFCAEGVEHKRDQFAKDDAVPAICRGEVQSPRELARHSTDQLMASSLAALDETNYSW